MSNEKTPTLQIAFRGTEDYRERLQDAARARKIKVQELLERAVEVYLTGSAAAEVAAQRAAAEQVAPPGQKAVVVPEEMVELIDQFVRWYQKQRRG